MLQKMAHRHHGREERILVERLHPSRGRDLRRAFRRHVETPGRDVGLEGGSGHANDQPAFGDARAPRQWNDTADKALIQDVALLKMNWMDAKITSQFDLPWSPTTTSPSLKWMVRTLSPMDFLEFMWTTSWPVVKGSLVLNPESPKIVKFWSANAHVFFWI